MLPVAGNWRDGVRPGIAKKMGDHDLAEGAGAGGDVLGLGEAGVAVPADERGAAEVV